MLRNLMMETFRLLQQYCYNAMCAMCRRNHLMVEGKGVACNEAVLKYWKSIIGTNPPRPTPLLSGIRQKYFQVSKKYLKYKIGVIQWFPFERATNLELLCGETIYVSWNDGKPKLIIADLTKTCIHTLSYIVRNQPSCNDSQGYDSSPDYFCVENQSWTWNDYSGYD